MQKLKNISFESTTLENGFWKSKYDVNKNVSIGNVYRRFEETGRFNAMRFARKEGEPVHVFYDSDVAKWIEAVAYLIQSEGGFTQEQEIIDSLVSDMIAHQLPSGYINSYFIQMEPDAIFTKRSEHELYCAGHLIEAAIAYDKATGKRDMLDMMLRYVDCIERAFITEKTAKFVTCGHEEIELALIKLYEYTGNKKYLDMALFFLDNRRPDVDADPLYDSREKSYCQSHLPVREQKEALGHAVRAAYLYIAMEEAAQKTDDKELSDACDALFEDITSKKMFITGGIGSAREGEAFTVPFDLPNLEAYSESCAAIGLMLFALSLQKKRLDSRYADTIERVMYNNLLSSVSMDGRSFFYENPLEVHLASVGKDSSIVPARRRRLPRYRRLEVFSCSCCPPNINRILARIGDFFFSEHGDSLVINQYGAISLENERISLKLETNYPYDAKIKLSGKRNSYKSILLRRPWWCLEYKLDGATVIGERNGYIEIAVGGDFEITLDLMMKPYFVHTNTKVRDNCGRVALCLGPTVYCMERLDNDCDLNALTVDVNSPVSIESSTDIPTLVANGYLDVTDGALYFIGESERTSIPLRFIPYRCFANRDACDMLVWVRKA
ncbi:MAG: glycoside hydrolase family 127 protein [Clostridia bacterium]|nr:glycoside hydrolase family 127 protein [Clostridia bacterium]